MIGPGPHARVEKDAHPARLNVVLVGRTAKGRKGLSSSTPGWLMQQVDPEHAAGRIRSGLSSGEGLIYNVRDAREEEQPIKERGGRLVDYQRVRVDEGVSDKRLLIIEPEFAAVLKRINGEANSLSAIMRQAWDSGNLATLTKQSPLTATGAHVSVLAHITEQELRVQLTETERANGFANRFLFLLVRRSKVLPEGAGTPDPLLGPLVDELREAVTVARTIGVVVRDEAARALWAAVYPKLSEGEEGMVGAILARAEAQVLRLSVAYALLDGSAVVRPVHLRAALAVWDVAEASARRIFGSLLGLGMADQIMAALRERPRTLTEIRNLFGRHKSAAEIQAILNLLEEQGRVRRREVQTGGRPATVWEVA